MIFAMMSTSRSESVTQFVRMNFSNIEALEANFDVFKWCFTNVLPVFYQCFTSVYQCFTSVLPVFYKCLPVFHRCFTSVTLMFHFLPKSSKLFLDAMRSSRSADVMQNVSSLRPLLELV